MPSIEETIRQKYPNLIWLLDHPEIGPLLRKAAENDWGEAELQGELFKTSFWQTTSSVQREWDALTKLDPATAGQRADQRAAQIKALARSLGLGAPTWWGPGTEDQVFRDIAVTSLRFGWTDDQIRQTIVSGFQYQGGGEKGAAAATVQGLRQMASDYLVPLSNEVITTWVQDILSGAQQLETFQGYLRQQAAALFPAWAKALEGGATVRTLMDGYLRMAAEELERDPDLLWGDSRIIGSILRGASVEGKLPSMWDYQKELRRLPEWRRTRGAAQLASDWEATILQLMGEI